MSEVYGRGIQRAVCQSLCGRTVGRSTFFHLCLDGRSHERWKQGSWRPQKANFDLDPSLFENGRTLPAEESVKEGEKKNRFAFRLKEDIIDADQQSNRLDDTSYGNNYRPQGSLGSGISNITIQKLKYNALADIKEELPDDLSYLYGTGEGARERNTAKVKLHSYDRLATPVEKRRAQVEKMLPEERSETPEAIMKDIRRRRDIEDAKSGMENHTSRRKYKRGKLQALGRWVDAVGFGIIDQRWISTIPPSAEFVA